MTNYLDNGTVLPFGLMGINSNAMMAGFNKTYKNTSLRVGVVTKSYPITDVSNRSKLTNEYDVSVVEQNENQGATTIIYKNCMSFDGFGSIADFFEKTFRPLEKKTTKGNAIDLKGQNGAIVLILCMDGMSDKGLIIGGFPHPDRPTTLTGQGPQLQGTFNGINVAVNTDGSASLTFNGATDNYGKVIDTSQKATTAQIAADGSVLILDAAGSLFSMSNDGSIQALTSNGNLLFLNNKTNEISINQKDGNTIGLNSTGVTISDATGKQIVTVNSNTVQLTSGGTISEQSAGHSISSGSVNISGLGGIKLKDQIGGELNIQNGMVALGNSTAELLDLFDQTLAAIETLTVPTIVGPSGPPINTAVFAAIKTKLDLIKGTL